MIANVLNANLVIRRNLTQDVDQALTPRAPKSQGAVKVEENLPHTSSIAASPKQRVHPESGGRGDPWATFCSRIGDTCCPVDVPHRKSSSGGLTGTPPGTRPWLTWAVAALGSVYGVVRWLEIESGRCSPMQQYLP